jgi:hypothetical protein
VVCDEDDGYCESMSRLSILSHAVRPRLNHD